MASVAHIIRRRRRRESRRRQLQARRQAGFALLGALLFLLVVLPTGIAFGGALVIYTGAVGELPTPESTIAPDPMVGLTQFYDRSGDALLFAVQDPLGDARAWVKLDTLPPYVVQATLRAEDPAFLALTGFDPSTTFLQLANAVLGNPMPTDSSITGRLARAVVLPPTEITGRRDPVREIAVIAELKRLYTPEQILEWHLNTNYYGSDAYGIDAAAQVYLGKRAVDLTLDEAALLAAIPLAPQYNPFENETAARSRQQDVLRSMLRANDIAQEQFDAAAAARTALAAGDRVAPPIAPEFARYARRQAEMILDTLGRDGDKLIARGGLRITTTLDVNLYYQSECVLRAHLDRLNSGSGRVSALDGLPCAAAAYLPPLDRAGGDRPPDSGIVAIIDVETGEIRSMVGAAGATAHQPGVTLQPFVYFAGFSTALYTPATLMLDISKPYPGAQEGLIYTPANPDGRFRGPMNLRDSMGAGLLPPAADVAYKQGIDKILQTAHRIGLNSLPEGMFNLMLLERDGEVSLLDVTYAYSVFASLGDMRGVGVEPIGRGYRGRDPVAVLKIEDAEGNILWEYREDLARACVPEVCTPVLLDGLGYLINDILADQETRWSILGQNNTLDLSRPSAVVNGLTADRVDDWTVGYTPQMVVGVHLGRADGGGMTLDAFGIDGAAAVWRAVMEYAHGGLPAQDWERPRGILEMPVCERSGLLPNGVCPVYPEIFLEGTEPRQVDSTWQAFDINSQTGQLATANTPADLRSERVFFVPPPEALEWWQANNLPLPPTEYDTVSRPELFGSAALLQPEAFAYIGGVVEVRGSLPADTMQFYQLAYGEGLNPAAWVDIGGVQTTYTLGAPLGQWDTTGLDGLYNLRLTVVNQDNTVETRVVQVTVDNIAPTISLSAGPIGKIYRIPGDTAVTLEAEVRDNLSIDRIEFFHNGELIGADTEYPYGFEWTIADAGIERFSATAYDAVGNSASSEVTAEIVRAG